MRGFRSGVNPVSAGLIAIVLIAIFTYAAFVKEVPFSHTYTVQAVFENSNLVQARTPVRIAGVDVGEVVNVERYKDTDLSLVTMEIDDAGRPVRENATMKVRPRLFLEGNFYIDLRPGTDEAQELADGGMIPVGQTSRPVQLDQVLTALQSDTRRSLQRTLKGFGAAVNSEPSPENEAVQDPEYRGLTGGQALNESLDKGPQALRDSAIVLDALRGDEPRDLSRTVRGIARLSAGLGANHDRLRDLVTNFNTTAATLAAHAPELTETVRLLGPFAANARRGFTSFGRSLEPTRQFARDILPGLAETPATVAVADPWLTQFGALLRPPELGGLLADLRPATSNLARLGHETLKFLPIVDVFNRCVTEVLIPTGNIEVDDGPHSANAENYKEFWYTMVGLAGSGQSFDGNGNSLRLSAPGGAVSVKTGKTVYGLRHQPYFGNYTLPPLETRPARPESPPPMRRDVPCHRNRVPDVNGPASIGPADGSRPDAAAPEAPAHPVAPASGAASLMPLSQLARRVSP